MWIAVFTAWLGAALLHNWEARKQTWMLIGLVVACGALDSARDRPPDQDAAAPSDGPSPDKPADPPQHRERGSGAVPDPMRPVPRR
jgi:hypothetical protein